MSHDQNFKNLILDYPRQALAFFGAEEAAAVDASARITPLRQEQLQERLGERFRELDVPLRVEWPDGRRAALLFVVETESAARRFDIHRLAHYCLYLAQLCETTRVVPVVIFLDAGHAAESLTLGGDRRAFLQFSYLSCRLPALPYKRYCDSDNLVARLTLPKMAWESSDEKVEAYAAAVRGLLELEPDPERRLKYIDFVDIYGALNDNEAALYARRYPQESEQMSGFAQRFREEGMEQGRQQGLQQGEAAVLLSQLEEKFGSKVAQAYRERVEQADTDTLLEWSKRILTAEDPETVFH